MWLEVGGAARAVPIWRTCTPLQAVVLHSTAAAVACALRRCAAPHLEWCAVVPVARVDVNARVNQPLCHAVGALCTRNVPVAATRQRRKTEAVRGNEGAEGDGAWAGAFKAALACEDAVGRSVSQWCALVVVHA